MGAHQVAGDKNHLPIGNAADVSSGDTEDAVQSPGEGSQQPLVFLPGIPWRGAWWAPSPLSQESDMTEHCMRALKKNLNHKE